MDNTSNRIDGRSFEKIITYGALNLQAKKQEINDLNVFPVPDGDTGENMCYTIMGGVESLKKEQSHSVDAKAKALARGMLLKARGNSGVILSQLFYGISEGLKGKETVTPQDVITAFKSGVEYAYKAVVKPVEGTILTVAREGSEGLDKLAAETVDFNALFEEYLKALTASLKGTPDLLAVLKEAGVVDSGGAGLVCIAEGFCKALSGEALDGGAIEAFVKKPDYGKASKDEDEDFGFCTEALVRVKGDFSLEEFKEKLLKEGQSIVAVVTDGILKIHIHTLQPLKVLGMCESVGEFITIKVENMTSQHENIIAEEDFAHTPERVTTAVVAVSQGDGFTRIYKDNGADMIIGGGQTDNPSVEQFLKAFSALNAENIAVLPNNKNIILAARKAAELYDGDARIAVVETKTPQEVFSALVCGMDRENFENFLSEMQDAAANVDSLSLTYAVRDANIGGITVKKGEYMGMYNGELVSANGDKIECLKGLLAAVKNIEEKEIVTVFYGKDLTDGERHTVNALLEDFAPDAAIEDFCGEQEVYYLLISLE